MVSTYQAAQQSHWQDYQTVPIDLRLPAKLYLISIVRLSTASHRDTPLRHRIQLKVSVKTREVQRDPFP